MTGFILRSSREPRPILACPSCGHQIETDVTAPILCRSCGVRYVELVQAAREAPRGPDGVPLGLPYRLTPADAVRALRWSEGALRGRLDRGEIACEQDGPNRRRYVLTSELARLERDGAPVDWDALARLYLDDAA